MAINIKNTIKKHTSLEFRRTVRYLPRRINEILTMPYLLFLQKKKKLDKKQTKKELIIVSLTSWKKRVQNVENVVECILNNTIVPDKIICNLSTDEFPLKEKELPSSILKLLEKDVFEIHWVKNNDKAFKKFIPTLKRYPNDIIICIDDDFIYPIDFVETFYNKYLQDPNTPLSGNNFVRYNVNFHCGCASLVKSVFFGKYIDEFYDDEVVSLGSSDVFFTYCAAMNGYYYKNVGKDYQLTLEPFFPIEGLNDMGELKIQKMMKLMQRKIKYKYFLDMSVKINKPTLSFK